MLSAKRIKQIIDAEKKMTREEKIQYLIDDDLESFVNDYEFGDYSAVANILEYGFIGYDKYTDEELDKEIKERKVILK